MKYMCMLLGKVVVEPHQPYVRVQKNRIPSNVKTRLVGLISHLYVHIKVLNSTTPINSVATETHSSYSNITYFANCNAVEFRDIKRKLAVFTARCICISAVYVGMRCLSVRLSVCLSATFVSCAKTNKDIFEIFSPCSHTILVFSHRTGWRYSNGNPLTGASNAKGV